MPVVVVTVTQVAGTITATPTAGNGTSLSPGTMAGIIVGSIVGGVLLIALVFYLFSRYTRRKFTRVAAQEAGGARSQKTSPLAHCSTRPSMSKEPLMSPASWPPLPTTSRVLSHVDVTPPSPSSTYDFGDGPGPDSAVLAQQSLSTPTRSSLGNISPLNQRASGDGATAPPTPKLQGLFIHRALQSRAMLSVAQTPSLDLSQSPTTTLGSLAVRADEEQFHPNNECTVRDAEVAQRVKEEEDMVGGDLESTESIYSQVSASFDHSEFFSDPVSRQNSPLSLPRRTPSRKQPRSPAPPTDLYPVAEVPDTPIAHAGPVVFPVLTEADSSLGGQTPRSHSVSDQSGAFPLLASTNFGRDHTSPVTPVGSVSSSVGWRSTSSGMFSRYPSLAPSTVAPPSRSVSHSETAIDWYHPPPGLAALSPMQIGSLMPSCPSMEGQAEQQDALPTPNTTYPAQVKHAHLREGTCRSLPEVEMKNVMPGGMAHIDVAL